MEQKQLKTMKKDYKKFLAAVGKDEVSSSNLDSSSKKLLKSLDFGSFCWRFSKTKPPVQLGVNKNALAKAKAPAYWKVCRCLEKHIGQHTKLKLQVPE